MRSNDGSSVGEQDPEVLIVGAGPTGLVLALWLTRCGIRVRIIDKLPEPATASRALAVQARTLEFYRQLGFADAVVDRGHRTVAGNMWVAGRRVGRIFFGDMGAGISPYPYALIFPQDEHERLLIDRLAALGVTVERASELVDFEQTQGAVFARITRSDGRSDSCSVAYVAGCDGAHSAVRETLNIGFAGGTYEHLFYVADVEASGRTVDGELHVALDRTDFLAVFPLSTKQRVRFVGTLREDAEHRHDQLSWSDVSPRVIEWLQIDVARVNWFSTYRVHHRVADRFRSGRAFLLGDAAHIHSPVGGQGMNTGIGDAVNLAWKLAAVLRGRADASLLATYEPERIAFAHRLVATTDRAFTGVTSSSTLARLLRLRVVPAILPALFASRSVRRLAFRTVSQTMVNYRESALSRGAVGPLRGGDRLPWVHVAAGSDADNYASLASLDWQVHVYGDVSRDVRDLCQARAQPLHVFGWQAPMFRGGLRRNGVYLVRPDGYVALAVRGDAAATALEEHLDIWLLGHR
jgi:2-polyprenyl-6-methoxyphenol hydroxylase-like FAD-dependent oxidoreductase